MRIFVFAKRNIKEILREFTNLVFLLGLPLFLLIIFQQFKIPNDVYSINNFAPAIVIFSYGFLTLFVSHLIAKDRTSSLLTRLFSSPMKPIDFLFGYTICVLPIALLQSIIFFSFSLLFGLEFSINVFYTILLLLPVSLLYISLGILIGCIASDRNSPAISSIIVQLICFTSGMWFDASMVGKVFGFICKVLPFKYTVDIARYSILGDFNKVLIPFTIVLLFIIVIYILSIIIFKNKMNNDKL